MERWGGSEEESNISIQDRTEHLFQQFPHLENVHVQSLFTQHPTRQRLSTKKKGKVRFAVSPAAVSPGQDRLTRLHHLGKGAALGHKYSCVTEYSSSVSTLTSEAHLGAIHMTVQGLPAESQETRSN